MNAPAPKLHAALWFGVVVALLALDLALLWWSQRPTAPLPMGAGAAQNGEAIAPLLSAIRTSMPKIQTRLAAMTTAAAPAGGLIAEYSPAAARAAMPANAASSPAAEGLAVLAIAGRPPIVMLGDRILRVGDQLPDGSTVSRIDRKGIAVRSAQGGVSYIHAFAALPNGAGDDSAGNKER